MAIRQTRLQYRQASASSSSGKRKAKSDKVEDIKPNKTPKMEQKDSLKAEADVTSHGNINITEETGDIFAAPTDTLLIHACNAQGHWGAGIAKAFKEHYPKAFKAYASHCKDHEPGELMGTALLIPPQDSNEQHFIGCLFTSRFFGKKKDSKTAILKATGPAMQDLLEQVKVFNEKAGAGEKVKEIWMCQINSGLFGVPWESTKKVISAIELDDGGTKTIKVVSRD